MAGNPILPTENIDEVILRLLALEPNEVAEIDYETYKSYLKELLVEVTSSRRKIAGVDVFILKNEFKRVRSKKGRFKIKAKKLSVDKLGLGAIRKQVKGTQQRLMLAPSGGVPKQISDVISQKSETSSLLKISETLDSILSTLTSTNSQNRKRLEQERKDTENKKRGAKEKELESRPIEGIKKLVSAVTKPFQSIWDKFVNFITNIILGRIVLKLIDWFGKEENQKKIQSIIRFFKDHWPVLLSLYLRFGTGIGRFIGKLGGVLIRGAFKLAALAAKLAVKAGIGKAGGKLSKVAGFLGGPRGKAVATGLGIAADVAVTAGAAVGIEKLAGGEKPTQKFSGGGAVRYPRFSGGGFNFKGMMGGSSMGSMFGPLGMLLGGLFGSGKPQEMFNGFVSGKKGVDKIPAMLSDGEFVMSAGAVRKYGVDTLESMNASGGGTNKPKVSHGTTYAAGGGLIGYAGDMIKHHEALSSLKPNQNYYISVKSPEYKKVNSNTKIYPYLDSVNVPTIGWGATYYDNLLKGSKKVKMGDPPITKKAADGLLNKHLGELIPLAKSRLPLWNKMSSQQQGTVVSFLYNAGPNSINPSGPYPKFSKSLIEGDMKGAAANVGRSGPPPSRINEEKRLLTSGPLDLRKAPMQTPSEKPKTEKKPSGILERISSGFSSFFTPPKESKTSVKPKDNTPKYAEGGFAPPQISSSIKPKNIKPLPKPSPIMYNLGVNGNRISNIPNSPTSSSKPPSLSPTHSRGTGTTLATLGVRK